MENRTVQTYIVTIVEPSLLKEPGSHHDVDRRGRYAKWPDLARKCTVICLDVNARHKLSFLIGQ
jgi:hypothetical protein